MTVPILLLASLLSGWILSLTRKGWGARALVTASVPLGAVAGWICGYNICRLIIFPFDGTPGSQHSWIGWVDAGLLGAVVGLVILPAIALAITKETKDEKDLT